MDAIAVRSLCVGAAGRTASHKGNYTLMSRATDEVGRVQSQEPRYNNMRKNFSAIVGYPVTVAETA